MIRAGTPPPMRGRFVLPCVRMPSTLSAPTMVRKSDGRLEPFQLAKIARSVAKAMADVMDAPSRAKAASVADRAAAVLAETYDGRIPATADVRAAVEETLLQLHLPDVAKAYVLYPTLKVPNGKHKTYFGITDDLKLGVNAIKVLERRYLRKDGNGRITETPSQMFLRVANAVAQGEQKYGASMGAIAAASEAFYRAMAAGEFLPNSPTLMNAGSPRGQLAACFVLPIKDELESIFDTLKAAALIHQSGGGTGFNFSALRPEGDLVRSTGGVASGPLSFMKLFDATTDVIKQGGRRRGANMGMLDASHPDVERFIALKSDGLTLRNFNVSVAATDRFLRAVHNGGTVDLVNPRTGKKVGSKKARDLFRQICTQAWATGDPGLVFIDEVNRKNPTAHAGRIDATNPCGEQPLHPHESCTLGSINLAKLAGKNGFDWEKLAALTRLGVRFLDDVIDVNSYPLPRVADVTKQHRRIGLGVMGFAEALIALGIPYASPKALVFADKVMKAVWTEGHKTSQALGRLRGSFPSFKGSRWQKMGRRHMRNATVTTVAPTGTISIIAGCSSGIEPLFAIAFVRNVMEGTRLLEVNAQFERVARARGFYTQDLLFHAAQTGNIARAKGVPAPVKKLFQTALEIPPATHVKMQAAFQKWSDNAVSKTINLPAKATVEDVRKAYLLAWKMKCKGITVYRYGTKQEQVLSVGAIPRGADETAMAQLTVDPEYAGGCPTPNCNY